MIQTFPFMVSMKPMAVAVEHSGKFDVRLSIKKPALKCPGLGNGGKVNVQLRIQTAKVEYGAKFDVYLSNKKGHL